VSMAQPAIRVLVVGGGVAACSFSRRILAKAAEAAAAAPTAPAVTVHVLEMGRGLGGRAATRRSRDIPSLRINHGSAYVEASTSEGIALMEELRDEGALVRWEWADGLAGVLTSAGDYVAEGEPAEGSPLRRYTPRGGDMSTLCEALARGSGNGSAPTAEFTFGKLARAFERGEGGGWLAKDGDGNTLGGADEFDWLVVTGSGLCHSRWTAAFGGLPPLTAAADTDELKSAVAAIDGGMKAVPVTAALMAFEGESARAWASLPFRKLEIEADPILSRVSVQPSSESGDGDGALTAVVLHSTADFASGASDVFGSTSTAARVGGAGTNAEREQAILAEMMAALKRRLCPRWLPTSAFENALYGPAVHRWGNAFSEGELLPSNLAVLPSSRVAFAGDYVAAAPEAAGGLERAALSGIAAADALLTHASKQQ